MKTISSEIPPSPEPKPIPPYRHPSGGGDGTENVYFLNKILEADINLGLSNSN
jgi:hypothetical protein